ncbi:hypothetical protein H5410_021870 [Solanum commersonii]|uniref:Uncharacterized protein n=1 Tax=Solanum commersonii TaxID=4109 RepID=A0A9J5ZDS1_SOLCO|nr:hypothetical protein H5410_021870 [Solanum commersonii]
MYSRWRKIGWKIGKIYASPTPRNMNDHKSKNSTISLINLLSLKVVWHKGLLGPLHVLSVVGTTQEHVMMAQIPTSSVVRRVIL